MQATHLWLLRQGFLAPCSSLAKLEHLLITAATQLAVSIGYTPILRVYTAPET